MRLSFRLGVRAAQIFTVTVVPQFPPEQIFRDWTPVLNEVSRLTGLHLKLKTYTSIPEFETSFLNGEPDFVCVGQGKCGAHSRNSGVTLAEPDRPKRSKIAPSTCHETVGGCGYTSIECL